MDHAAAAIFSVKLHRQNFFLVSISGKISMYLNGSYATEAINFASDRTLRAYVLESLWLKLKSNFQPLFLLTNCFTYF